MKLNQDGILPEDKAQAIKVRNYLIAGNRVIGDPGESLRQTLIELENKRDNKNLQITDWEIKDTELEAQIAMTKAGILGEESLCEYLAKLIKYDDKLEGLIAFASLSYDLKNNNKEYIPDTDTLLVYGNHLLVIDAKNIKTKPGQSLMLLDGIVIDANKGKEILEVHPSTHIWINIMKKAGIPIDSIDGYVCIVNNTEIDIVRNDEWYESHTKLIHISELKSILEHWVEGKNNTTSLKLLTEISKAQVKKEKNVSFNIDDIKRKFNI